MNIYGGIRFVRGVLMVVALALPLPALAADDPAVAEGTALLERQEYSRAAKSFEAAIARGDDSARAWGGLGRARLRLGVNSWGTNLALVGKGVEALRQARELDPAAAVIRFDLGTALLAMGDRSGAESELAGLQGLDPVLAAELQRLIAASQPPQGYRAVGGQESAAGNGASVEPVRESVPVGGSVTPVAISGNTVFVPVTLSHGSRSVQVQLILDTGATLTTITPEIASQLDMRLDQAVTGTVPVGGGGEVTAHGVRLERVAVGPHTKNGMNVAVIDNRAGRLQYDGLLGMDFLRGLHYRLDFDGKAIHWLP